jgi:hypothetical protein
MLPSSWVLEALSDERVAWSDNESARRLLMLALDTPDLLDGAYADKDLRFVAEAMELAVLDLLDADDRVDDLRIVSEKAFQLLRVMSLPDDPDARGDQLLRTACLGVLGDRGADVARYLKHQTWPEITPTANWGSKTKATIRDAWLLVLRKKGWEDLDRAQERVLDLRRDQRKFEEKYLESLGDRARTAAWELIALYHLSKAAEILAVYATQGEVDGRFDIRQQLEAQFDRALVACGRAELVELETTTRLLARTARQLVENSIWTVTRSVDSQVSSFVRNLVSRESARPIFEVLPPQRRTLREEGLLGSSYRAVVVNLPTSSGKTFIAQFRILQALNQFEREGGWVAYVVPTRALVNQITARLRQDFSPLGINVERVSPALEIDALEANLLTDADERRRFRVLVVTTEKLDLLLRGGWEEKIDRPLTLVVVDEAHNLARETRGLRLELLLATINRECRYAQFLLLTPFVDNADDIARWLAPDSNDDISLSMEWQPNDLAVLISRPQPSPGRSNFHLELRTIFTTRKTLGRLLSHSETLELPGERPLGLTRGEVNGNLGKLAAATAHTLSSRGPVIVLAGRVSDTWRIARTLQQGRSPWREPPDSTNLVQRFLAREFGSDFPLVELVGYGIGVHHSGLSDEARVLMEWLLEHEHLRFLVATTTIAQGVNFPVSGVVMASYQYPYGEDMPPEDFWNIAGRAGRIDQESLGLVVLVANNDEREERLREFVNRRVLGLNSTLTDMVRRALHEWGHLELHRLHNLPEWSAFLQYLAHSYRQIGNHEQFALEVEQVLRGTLGFQDLRAQDPRLAGHFIAEVQNYAERIAGKPLSLVDETGFSWESVNAALIRLSEERITADAWDPDTLFSGRSRSLQRMMGVLLDVPELRENLERATGRRRRNGDLLARMVSDWVNGASLTEMTEQYFSTTADGDPLDPVTAMTECCQNVFGCLTQPASWGLAALQALTLGPSVDRLSEAEQRTLRNLPARVFYGVNSDDAIALRLLGVPRGAAQPLARVLNRQEPQASLQDLRTTLAQGDARLWNQALGSSGSDYFSVWNILEGNV